MGFGPAVIAGIDYSVKFPVAGYQRGNACGHGDDSGTGGYQAARGQWNPGIGALLRSLLCSLFTSYASGYRSDGGSGH